MCDLVAFVQNADILKVYQTGTKLIRGRSEVPFHFFIFISPIPFKTRCLLPLNFRWGLSFFFCVPPCS